MNLEGKVRVIPYKKIQAGLSMAIDSTLLDQMEKAVGNGERVSPILRFYSFSNPTVVLGYRQKIEGRYDPGLAKKMKTQLTIRDSGGGHMYFGTNDLHLSFISPGERTFGGPKLIKRYHKMNSIVSQALRALGYETTLGRTSIRINEEGGKLLAGTATREESHAYLHQIGILVDNYNEDIFRLLMARPDEVEKWKNEVTSLSNHKKMVAPELYHHITSLIGDYYVEPLTSEELLNSEKLNQQRYSNDEFICSGTKKGNICLIAGEASDKNKEERTYA